MANKFKSANLLIGIGVGAAVLVGCLLIAAAVALIVIVPLRAEAQPTATLSLSLATLPPTITIGPTQTPIPTDAPPEIMLPTRTPQPTDPPQPAAATAKPPTATPTPMATQPPQPTAPPGQGHGLTDIKFWLDKTEFNPGEEIWFHFDVRNASSNDLSFGHLGPTIFKGGVWLFNKPSWTSAVLKAGDRLEWYDWFALNESGTYDLRLAICYSLAEQCDAGSGEWELLSPPVTIVIH